MDIKAVSFLLEQYKNGTLTREEADQLSALLHESTAIAALEAELENTFKNSHFNVVESPERREELNHLILAKIKAVDAENKRVLFAVKKRLPHLTWLKYAAVVLVISGTALYLSLPVNTSRSTRTLISQPVRDEISPGTDKATLTLADGSVIILDSSSQGLSGKQGITKYSTAAEGVLTYKDAGRQNDDQVLYNTVSTPRGGRFQVVLSDGSRVWLNAASSLHFPAAFVGTSRNVELTGEAYFEVAKNKEKPFCVKTQTINVQVLGTKFNLNAYENEHNAKATLCEGSIKLSSHNSQRILKPGQQASVSKNENIEIIDNTDIDEVIAWKNGLFNFKGADLFAIIRQLERWYDIEIIYPPNMPDYKFQGKLPRDLQLSQVLKILGETEVRFTMKDRTLTLLP